MEALAAQWTENQNADVLNNLNRLVDALKKNQKAGECNTQCLNAEYR